MNAVDYVIPFLQKNESEILCILLNSLITAASALVVIKGYKHLKEFEWYKTHASLIHFALIISFICLILVCWVFWSETNGVPWTIHITNKDYDASALGALYQGTGALLQATLGISAAFAGALVAINLAKNTKNDIESREARENLERAVNPIIKIRNSLERLITITHSITHSLAEKAGDNSNNFQNIEVKNKDIIDAAGDKSTANKGVLIKGNGQKQWKLVELASGLVLTIKPKMVDGGNEIKSTSKEKKPNSKLGLVQNPSGGKPKDLDQNESEDVHKDLEKDVKEMDGSKVVVALNIEIINLLKSIYEARQVFSTAWFFRFIMDKESDWHNFITKMIECELHPTGNASYHYLVIRNLNNYLENILDKEWDLTFDALEQYLTKEGFKGFKLLMDNLTTRWIDVNPEDQKSPYDEIKTIVFPNNRKLPPDFSSFFESAIKAVPLSQYHTNIWKEYLFRKNARSFKS